MNAPLPDVLDGVLRLVEFQLTGIFASILLLDGDILRHVAAPSLPATYLRAVDGLRIGPDVGSCGAAAYRREFVIVEDIMADPIWANAKDFAAADGLRSCWSTPIMSHEGTVLGTFAMYSKEVRKPSPVETRLVDSATRLAGIAITREQAEVRIRFMANHDLLTGLPNCILLNDRLKQALSFAQR